jgi:hypothetical protein
MCTPCAKAKGLSSGDITGKMKANNKLHKGISRHAATAAAAEYKSLHSNVDNSSSALMKALAVAKTNLTVKLAAIQAKNPGRVVMASIFVASEGRGHLVLREGRESSLQQNRNW